VRRVMAWLSSTPEPWSALRLRASGLPIVFPGQWCMTKSNWAKVSDHCTCLRLSFFGHEVFQAFMIHPDLELIRSSFQKVPPFFQCSDDG
jgi:hypothetical protein